MRSQKILYIALVFLPVFTQAQWFWQNPLPQGNPLQSTSFVSPLEGWVCGYHGTIMHTNNGAVTWDFQSTGTVKDLKRIFFLDSMHGWAVGSGLWDGELILRTEDGGNTWETRLDTANGGALFDLFFTDLLHGWTVGAGGEVLCTGNGGITWTKKVIANMQYTDMKGVFFQDAQKGWIVGESGTILKTTNAGQSWTQVSSGTTDDFYGVHFSSAMDGVITCNQSVRVTHDGGVTWIPNTSCFPCTAVEISYASADTGMIFGCGIWKTTNAGASWQLLNNQDCIGGAMTNGQIVYAVGGIGTILKSMDAGLTWNQLSSQTLTGSLNDAWFTSEDRGWLIQNQNSVLATSDGGESWDTVLFPVFYLRKLVFSEGQYGWVCGYHDIYYTENGGQSWTSQFHNVPGALAIQDIHFPNRYRGWACATDTVLRSENGGYYWYRSYTGFKHPTSIWFADGMHGWVAGEEPSIIKTTDGGLTWTATPVPGSVSFQDITFSDLRHGWAAGWTYPACGCVARTTDGGESWQTTDMPGVPGFTSVCFADSLNGWVCGSSGNILHTIDGGCTWDLQASISDWSLYRVFFLDKHTGWSFGGYGSILKTHTGGMVGVKPDPVPENNLSMNAWPNPADNRVNVRFETTMPGPVSISITDRSGTEIRNQNYTAVHAGFQEVVLNLAGLSNGLYLCIVRSDRSIHTQKIIVNR